MTQEDAAGRAWPVRALVISAGLAALGYLAFSLWGGWREVMAALAQVTLLDVGVLLLLSLVNYGLRFVRWQYYLGRFGHGVAWGESLRIYLAGFALTTTPGKAGEALRSVLLAPHAVAYPHSLAALLAERLGDLLAVVALAALGLAGHPEMGAVLVVSALLVAAALGLLQQRRALAALDGWLRRRLSGRLARVAAGMVETVLHSGRLFTLPLLSGSLLLGIVAWGAEGVAFYYLLAAMGQTIEPGSAVAIYAFAMLAGALSFLPGGLGGAEVAMVALLLLGGVPEPVAVAATLLIRVTTLWFAVMLGIAALLPGRSGRAV